MRPLQFEGKIPTRNFSRINWKAKNKFRLEVRLANSCRKYLSKKIISVLVLENFSRKQNFFRFLTFICDFFSSFHSPRRKSHSKFSPEIYQHIPNLIKSKQVTKTINFNFFK